MNEARAPLDTAGQTLQVENVSHRFGAATALDGVSLDVANGELVALLGPSGCGKTTLLRAIGGFIAQSEGRIHIGGAAVDHLPPNKRAVGIVFQNYALFPHMDVAANIAYPLKLRGVSGAALEQRVAAALATVQLEGYGPRRIDQLSGSIHDP